MNRSTVNIALAGIGGYGDLYVEVLLPRLRQLRARLVGVVDPEPRRCQHLADLQQGGVPIHATLEDLFDDTAVDLMLIVTPIHLHAQQTAFALKQGANVLCEKPIAGTLHDALHMAEAHADASGFVGIGYQWSFSQAVQALKRDVMAGMLGKPLRLQSQVFFPRPLSYFCRNDWAGRKYTADGQGVFDSPVNNAAAHYLHNMFYLLGATRETSAMPAAVQAELYRANEIENYDTAAIRCRTESGAEILFFTSHCVAERRGPRSRYEFERAIVEYDFLGSGQFVARFHDGRVKHYGHPNLDRHDKVWQAIDACRTGEPLACGIPAAMAQAVCAAAAQESSDVIDFPPQLRRVVGFDGEAMVAIDSLADQLTRCYERAILPSEDPALAQWARPSRLIDLTKRSAMELSLATAARAEAHGHGSNGNGAGARRPEVTIAVRSSASPKPSVELQ